MSVGGDMGGVRQGHGGGGSDLGTYGAAAAKEKRGRRRKSVYRITSDVCPA